MFLYEHRKEKNVVHRYTHLLAEKPINTDRKRCEVVKKGNLKFYSNGFDCILPRKNPHAICEN